MAKFDDEMKKAKNNINSAIEKAMRGTAIDMFSAIVKATPVGNPSTWKSKAPEGYIGGQLRGNWQANVARPLESTLNTRDATGGRTINNGANKIDKFKIKGNQDNSIYFTNNLPYAERIEKGWSDQAASGFVRITVKEFNKYLKNNAIKFEV